MMKLNIGGGKGTKPKKGWSIVDRSKSADIVCDVEEGIPVEDNSVSAIYASMIMEHIHPEKQGFVWSEFYRILKKKSFIRVVVPDVAYGAMLYLDNRDSDLEKKSMPYKTLSLPKLPICYFQSWLISFNKFGKLEHKTAFDSDLLNHYLCKAKFSDVGEFSYGLGSKVFKGLDKKRYEECGLFVEAVKWD